MQRILKYDNIQNISLTPDEELNIFIHGKSSYVITYRRYKMVLFLAHPVQCTVHQGYCTVFFSNKVISRCNLLHQRTVDAPSINAFKSRLECVGDSRMGFFMN